MSTVAIEIVRLGAASSALPRPHWPDRIRAGSVHGARPPEIGDPAPPLMLTGLDGKMFDLAKHRGKVVLVNYWATWCAPCRKEMPTLDAFYRRYRSEGLELIGISVDFHRDLTRCARQ